MSALFARAPKTARALLAFSLALFFLACAVPLTALAQTFTLSGSVSAEDGTPVPGARITLSAPAKTLSATSDARGAFAIEGVASGTYAVAVSAPGYAPIARRTVTVGETNATLTLVLARSTTNSLTVIGHVSAASGNTVPTNSGVSTVINAQTAAASGETTVGEMVWNQLSVTPVIPLGGGSNATTSFSLRDPDPTETLVEIDGHPVNNGNTGDFDVSLVDPAALQDVQLVYGISPASLLGPNTIGGAINITTLEPTATPHGLIRIFGGSYGSYGATTQATGSDGLWGYAFSFHAATSDGSVNQTILAPNPYTGNGLYPQFVGSSSNGETMLSKLRYQLGGPNGYGYIQVDYRDQAVYKDESALLSSYTPGQGYTSGAGTTLGAHQANYGLDAQVPLGDQLVDGAPATVLQFSHLTTLASQSVGGPLLDSLPYLYNQRDLLNDDWLQIDHHFSDGTLSFKYDLGTESLDTEFVQSQVTAQIERAGGYSTSQEYSTSTDPLASLGPLQPFQGNAGSGGLPINTLALSQTERSAVLRYDGDPTSKIHYALATYFSNYSTFGTSFDPRAGFVWTPTGNTAVRASVGTTFQIPQLSELVTLPAEDLIPVDGYRYNGNPDLKPDFATEYDLGAEQIFGSHGHQLHLSFDLYQTNLRSPANQLNPLPIPNCQTPKNPVLCPLSTPVNAGDGPYRGFDLSADQQLGSTLHLRAGWSVDSSFLTTIPLNIQDGTLQAGVQSLGQPLQKGYLAIDRDVARGLEYGARLTYEGIYNELDRSPYATLDAHVAWNGNGYQIGLYGTNLTNAYSQPFTIVNGGIIYGGETGQPVIPTNAYTLQGSKVLLVLTRSL